MNPRESLLSLRNELLALHKELIHSERVVYERGQGVIPSPTTFLQLLTTDPFFAWMLPLSSLIAKIDAALADRKEPVTEESAADLLRETRALLSPAEHGEGFAGRYFQVLQRDPHVVMAQAACKRLWSAAKTV